MSRFAVSRATPEDAPAIAALLQTAFAGRETLLPVPELTEPSGVATLLQTGSELLVASGPGGLPAGVVRLWSDDGVEWFDLLTSRLPGAGRALIRAVEQRAQDLGLRLVRTTLPADERLPWVFQRWGYLPIARADVRGVPMLTAERRVPLLTVREQRRSDASELAALTGEDPWQFEQGVRPGWFVLADGERVAGAIVVRDARGGFAEFSVPVLDAEHRGRGLELWMIGVGVRYAETKGFHTASLPSVPETDRLARELEDRHWFPEGQPRRYVRRLGEHLPD